MAYVTIDGKLVKVERINKWLYKNGRQVKVKSTNIAEIADAVNVTAVSAKFKGVKDGNCNVTACQKPGASWWNTSTRRYYCGHCAREINRWSQHDEGYDICYTSEEAAIVANAMFT